jgi:hypothetical protein
MHRLWCMRVCESDAVISAENMPAGAIECDACPIKCWIQPGYIGACHRYRNEAGKPIRLTPLHTYADVEQIVGPEPKANIRKPNRRPISCRPNGAASMSSPWLPKSL